MPWVDAVVVADLPRAQRRSLASTLADVLVALHVPAPAGAPLNPFRGVPLATRDDAVRKRLARLGAPGGYLEGSGLDVPRPATAGGRVGRQGHVGSAGRVPRLLDALVDTWQAGLLAPGHDGAPLWVHGDLHAANLVATTDAPHGLAAVVDWGDVSAGDPATGLAVAWLVLDGPGREAFRDRLRLRGHRCADDPAAHSRARAWALTMATAMAEHAAPGTGHHALATGALAEILGLEPPAAVR